MQNSNDEFPEMDMRGLPSPVCPACGETWVVLPVKFCKDSYTIVMWGTDGHCYKCKTLMTACTPEDLPEFWKGPTND